MYYVIATRPNGRKQTIGSPSRTRYVADRYCSELKARGHVVEVHSFKNGTACHEYTSAHNAVVEAQPGFVWYQKPVEQGT